RREGKTIYYSLASEDVRKILTAIYDVFCEPVRKRRR
ncbi:MAG: transcriptional regulator, partial [Bradyrhizobium sp.]|nr:transcriptional regulator [Bradyrhizobium sp.]